jgi:hypothetical protein
MTPRIRLLPLVLLLCAIAAAAPAAAGARPPSTKKGIWGPATARAFGIYHRLGSGVYITSVRWSDVARSKPSNARNPADRAYDWPSGLSDAARLAKRRHMKVAVQITGAPRWANGGRPWRWAPKRPKDFANFTYAISKRYPSIHLWVIWGEPSRRANFMPETPEHRRTSASRRPAHMGARQKRAPHRYARILDASYVALHKASRRNKVIGGNTFTTGDISPYNWIRNLRLPSGRPPRMDMYGHNPFTMRTPNLHDATLGYGLADYSDLDNLAGWLDRYLKGRRAGPRHLKLFLAEFTAPTDHPNHDFNFWVDRKTQARFLRAALRIARHSRRIYSMCWISLYDENPRADHLESNKGLIDQQGRHKPAFRAYRRG